MSDAKDNVAVPDDLVGELLDVKQVAAWLNCSVRNVYRLADAGRMPAPVRLGGLTRWRRAELREWLAAGCPHCRRSRI